MDAVNALQHVFRVQHAFQVLVALALTAYLFPKQAVVRDNEEYDFLVVGAGSAGTVVAYRLAQCGHRVLLVEAGGDPPVPSLVPALFPYLSHTDVDWNYTSVPMKDRFQCFRAQTLNLTSGHVLGGGSSINYMFYVRGCPGDFNDWAVSANDSSWDYDSMLPYFIKSERLEDKEVLSSRYRRYHGTKGFLGVTRGTDPKVRPYLESFKELGNAILLDINGENSLGYTQQMFTIAEGVRQSTAYSILAQRKDSNLHLLKRTFVTRILFDDTNNAIGVRAITEDEGEITIRAKNEVILSAGALNTPRILMTSGIGPAEHLKALNIPVRKDLPVGENLQDHMPVLLSFKMDESNEPPPPTNPQKFPFPAFTGYVALNATQTCPTYQAINMLIPAGSTSPMQLCAFNYGLDFDICQNLYEAGKHRNTMFVTFSLLHPKSRGRVFLRSADPQDPPLVNVGYRENGEDLEMQVDSVMDFIRVLNTSYFRSVGAELADLKLPTCEGFQYASRDWWRCYVRCLSFTLYHYSGTSALGAVVDRRLRVFGAGRLRVVDAGVMPRIVGANINAATIAIGEKGADIIAKEYYCRSRSLSDLLHDKLKFWQF